MYTFDLNQAVQSAVQSSDCSADCRLNMNISVCQTDGRSIRNMIGVIMNFSEILNLQLIFYEIQFNSKLF